jgi:hypothetical protein
MMDCRVKPGNDEVVESSHSQAGSQFGCEFTHQLP